MDNRTQLSYNSSLVFVDSATGNIAIVPRKEHADQTYTAELRGLDEQDVARTVKTWNFSVAFSEFRVLTYRRMPPCNTTRPCPAFDLATRAQAPFPVQESFRFPAVNKNLTRVEPSDSKYVIALLPFFSKKSLR